MRNPKVLFIMEGWGYAFAGPCSRRNVQRFVCSKGNYRRFIGNTYAPPAFLLRPSSKLFQRLVKAYE